MGIIKSNAGALEFFLSIPDDVLAQVALHDWEALENLCIALTLDIHFLEQKYKNKSHEDSSNRGSLC